MIDYLFWFPLIWLLSFIFHEYMHCFEHLRQGGHSYEIELWTYRRIPSLRVMLHGVQRDPDMVKLAGGLYTSLVHLLILTLYIMVYGFNKTGFTFSIICIGLIQFCYGYYEMTYYNNIDDDEYMNGHYVLYGVVFMVFCLVWVMI